MSFTEHIEDVLPETELNEGLCRFNPETTEPDIRLKKFYL